MKNFEYAQPHTESEAVELLADESRQTAVLAGGTDLVGLMKRMVVNPDLVVNIGEIESLRHLESDDEGNLWVGAAVKLDEFLDARSTDDFPSVKQVIQGISSIQLQSQGTVVGEVLRRPTCWYFRNGHGLLADSGRLVTGGDNRYHAILGNRGAAKFVNASRMAPALISLGAKVRLIGPEEESEQFLNLQELYRTPGFEGESENVLRPGQLVTHIIIPPSRNRLSAAYEVRHGEGPDQPLAAAAVSMDVTLGTVRDAAIVLGQVAPVPWLAVAAARALIGKSVTEATATAAGAEAVRGAIALSENEYKIQLTQVAVKRAVLRAAGMETGGLDFPVPSDSFQQLTSTNLV
ncbi:MAG: FAD binding domain-containing protein [Planctomycetaceae bacterium]